MLSFLRRRQPDSERKKRKHHVVPFVENPLSGADEEEAVFCQRHEASSIELFFDLFFVANLATFTAYHSINDRKGLTGYIGFFAIIWSTWFQVTLHDVRFARDSVYERTCKAIQFVVFVGFALVGSNFDPGTDKSNSTSFRILCYALFMSRGLFTLQYAMVLICTVMKKGYKKLYLPLGLNILIYVVGAVVFAAMSSAFREGKASQPRIHALWYIVLCLESIGTIAISCNWRMLSFKKTHLVERMSLLTLIVIGEGAIGITKTVSRIMGKSGLDAESCGLILCIIFILVFLWVLYFDNHPTGHYGTIRQQIWSILHFPLQLAIVGIVEGSQQIALARYVIRQSTKLDLDIYNYCMVQNLDGSDLVSALVESLDYFKFESKVESERWIPVINNDLWIVGNNTGICSPENTFGLYDAGFYPIDLLQLFADSMGAIYASLGVKMPVDKSAFNIAVASWKIVYMYYWASLTVLLICLIAFLWIIRRNKSDLFDWVSISSRGLGLIVSLGLLGVAAKDTLLFTYLSTPSILPTVAAILFCIIFLDHFSRMFCNWRLRRSGAPFDDHTENGHGHEHGHGKHDAKGGATAHVTETGVSNVDTSYNPVPQVFAPQYTPEQPTPQLPYNNHIMPQYTPMHQTQNAY